MRPVDVGGEGEVPDRGPDDVAAAVFGDVLHKQHATVIKLFRKPLFHHAVLNKPDLAQRSWGDAPNAGFSAHSESTRAVSTGRHCRSAPIKRELAVSVMEPLLAKFLQRKSNTTT
jgi:hypothetical protein